MFTLHVCVPISSALGQRIPFLQHLAALAVVEAVCTLPGYEVGIPLLPLSGPGLGLEWEWEWDWDWDWEWGRLCSGNGPMPSCVALSSPVLTAHAYFRKCNSVASRHVLLFWLAVVSVHVCMQV